MQQFQNKRALVTGASSGIGQAIARALAAQGAQIHAVARSWPEQPATADGWELHVGDFTVEADVRRVAAELASSQAGQTPLDLLIHCAGALEFGTVADFPVAQLD